MESLRKLGRAFKGLSLLKKTALVFGLMVLFVLLIDQPWKSPFQATDSKILFPKLEIGDVSRIELSNLSEPHTNIALEKEEGQWRVVNGRSFPGDQGRIAEFLKLLSYLKSGTVASNNPDRFGVYGLGVTPAPHVQVFDGENKVVVDFNLGTRNLAGGQHLQVLDSKEVLQVPQNLDSFVLQPLDNWRDRTLFAIDEKSARRLVLSTGEEDLVLEKKADVWRVVEPEDYEADKATIDSLFGQLKNLKADSFADSLDGSQADFHKPKYKISIRFNDDSLKLVLFAEAKDKPFYYAKNGDRNMIYTISSGAIDSMFGLKFKTVNSK